MDKSQVSIEYLLIIGFATMLAVPLLIIYNDYTSGSRDSIASGQALQIARNIADSSEQVYYLGKPSQTTLKINFPGQIHSTNLSNKEIVIRISTSKGVTDIVQPLPFNISGSLPTTPGVHIVTIKAEDSYVQVTSN